MKLKNFDLKLAMEPVINYIKSFGFSETKVTLEEELFQVELSNSQQMTVFLICQPSFSKASLYWDIFIKAPDQSLPFILNPYLSDKNQTEVLNQLHFKNEKELTDSVLALSLVLKNDLQKVLTGEEWISSVSDWRN